MSSISTKIKIATLIGITTLVGIVLYVKADRTAEDESLDSSYTVRSSPTTNLNAVMKAHPRANEYTSSEYSSKMAPSSTQASEYLALYEGDKSEEFTYQDDSGYRRKTAPTTHQAPVPDRGKKQIEGQRAAQSSSDSYENFGVRSAVVKDDTIQQQEEEEEDINAGIEDPRLHIATDAKQRVVGVDSYSRAISNAETNDNAYQVNNTQQEGNTFRGYAVRSADRQKQGYADTTEDGYARKRAPQGDINTRGSQAAQSSLATTDGYARKRAPQSAGQNATSIAQYDNAKGNDKAYKAEGDSYGGYTVRSPKKSSTSIAATTTSEGGYARRKAPQGTANNATTTSTSPRNTESEYGGYAVRSAKGKDVQVVQQSSSDDTYGGYAVRTPKKKSTNTASLTTEGGYARRRAPQSFGGAGATNLAQYDNANKNDGAYKADETYGGYAVRTPKKKSTNTASREYAQGGSNETYGGYAVRSAGKKKTRQTNNNSAVPRTSRPRGGVPASTGLKMYGSRGERLTASTSQKDRSVIVMPKRGRSVAGIVVQDDPGRSIIVKSTTGVQSTYRYGEIDALVNL